MWGLLTALTLVDAWGGKYATEANLPGLNWQTIETERFRIHYPESKLVSARRTAIEVAEVADEILERIEVAQGSHLNETLHIVLLDHDDALSGFTIPQWDWVVISAHQGPDLHRTRGRQAWIPGVLAHEFAHLVAHKRAGALAEGANYGLQLGIFGDGGTGMVGGTVTLRPHEPYWWAEGGAEYLSERAGYNWWSTARDANLRMTVLSGRLLSWRELQSSRDKDSWNDAERGYQQGYAFARWLDRERGPGTFTAIAERSRRGIGRWDAAISDVLGQPGADAWASFADELRDHYVAQRSEIAAVGVVEGAELDVWPKAWESDSLRARDGWAKKPQREKEAAQAASGGWNLYPKYSEDGAWYAEHRVGWIRVRPIAESLWPAFSGERVDGERASDQLRLARELGTWLPARFGYGYDFIPGQQALVVTAPVGTDRPRFAGQDLPYSWNQLFVVDLTPDEETRRHREGQETWDELDVGGTAAEVRSRYEPIPNSGRGSDPAVSPDGERVTYLQYSDGTMNLVISGLHGENWRALSSFDDGTWLQGPDWSPDGTEIVVSMSRNFQQNLWIVDVETGSWTPLTEDAWEERDPHWAEDGIYFAADPTGVFNVFRWSEGAFSQITNVVGGASTPSITPRGNLLFSSYTAGGHKSYGLHRDEFLEMQSSSFTPGQNAELSWRPDVAAWPAHRYRPLESIIPPSGGPVIRLDYDNGGPTPRGGGYLKVRDYLENHDLSFFGLTGRDHVLEAAYTLRAFRPDIQLWRSFESSQRGEAPAFAGSFARVVPDEDREHATVVSGSGAANSHVVRRILSGSGLVVSWPWHENLLLDAGLSHFELRYVPDTPNPAFLTTRATAGVTLGKAANARLVDDDERRVTLAYVRGQSEVNTGYGVPRIDDFTPLDRYGYNQIRSTMRLAFPFAGVGRHRLDVGWDLIYTDRNLYFEEEPRAGGDHPYAMRLALLEPSVEMPGYAAWALRGEELAIGRFGWRFPVIGQFARRGRGGAAPYLEQIWMRAGTDFGNVWGANNLPDNGNGFLADVSLDVRLAASIFDASWDSLFGVAYGIHEVRTSTEVPEPLAYPVAGETSGPRLYVGLGTGW